MSLVYGSVCSGIEAASVAWEPLGWEPAFFAEIEKFPSAVLAHHYPEIPNYGDMTKFKEWPDHGSDSARAIDILVGGTPCQSFSIAGLRAGLADPRGNLMLTYLAIAAKYSPRWLVWENVPGVLSSNGGRDFGTFLGALGQLGYGFAYRVLDAQFCRTHGFSRAVPQRRRRVFVVGHLGDWRRAAAVLFDAASLQGDPAPRRKAGQSIAHPVAPSLKGEGPGSGRVGDIRGQDPVIAVSEKDISGTVSSKWSKGSGGPAGDECQNLVAFNSREDPEVTYDRTGPLGASSPQAQAIAFDTTQITSPGNYSNPKSQDACHPLAHGAHPPAIAYDMRGREGGAQMEGPHDTANIRAANGGSSRSYIAEEWAVRRLTPVECEKLQGFPESYTAIPWRNKAPENCPDGPRYKALGNSMAVNVMRVIGERIAMVDAMNQIEVAA